jgi:putative phosphoribosyl transferase
MFEAITNKFHFKFRDRIAAANILVASLKDNITKEELTNNAVSVLGIPRGGLVLADVIATKLKASHFDLVIPRKLTIPNNEEAAFGAIMSDGTIYIDYRTVRHLNIPQDYIEKEKSRQLQEIQRRYALYTKETTGGAFKQNQRTVGNNNNNFSRRRSSVRCYDDSCSQICKKGNSSE